MSHTPTPIDDDDNETQKAWLKAYATHTEIEIALSQIADAADGIARIARSALAKVQS